MRVEFFGPPGCGKTYLKEMITGENREEIRRKATGKFILWIKSLSKYAPQSIYYKRKVMSILKGKELKYHFFNTDWHYDINNFIMVGSAYFLRTRSGILDEGLIQRIISFCVNYSLANECMFRLIDVFSNPLSKVNVVYVHENADVIFEAVKVRNRKISAMDFLDNDRLREYLAIYIEKCEAVHSKYDYRMIQRKDFPEYTKEYKTEQ